MSEVRYFQDKFPRYTELNAANLWHVAKEDDDLCKYFPDKYFKRDPKKNSKPKGPPPKHYILLVLNSIRRKPL